MTKIRFAQVSDTHLRTQGQPDMMAPIFDKLPDADEQLAHVFDELEALNLDFVIATGDLVHEGIAADYARFKAISEAHLTQTPLYVCLGNHDRKQAFYEGYLGMAPASDEEAAKPYRYAVECHGLRVIALDSACSGGEFGRFDEAEIDWLAGVLETPAPDGSIIMWHHPVSWDFDQMAMEMPERLAHLIEGSDVRAIFTGHTHTNDIRHVCGVPQVTADSTLFGCEFNPETLDFTDKASYNLCTLDETGLSLRNRLINPKQRAVAQIDIKVLIAAMQGGAKPASVK